MERWRRPAKVLDIDEEPAMVHTTRDGRTFGTPRITVDQETSDRIRTGHMCALCFEPFEQAWPEICGFCGARVRDGQGAFFERMYQGEELLPGGFNTDDEIEIMVEQLRREGKL